MLIDLIWQRTRQTPTNTRRQSFLQLIHVDGILLSLLVTLCTLGLIILFSASNKDTHSAELQAARMLIAFIGMFFVAQVSPNTFRRFAPWLYGVGLFFLIIVLMIGHIGKGGQRWINLGFFKLQPAEIMKLAIPMMLAWYYHRMHLPVSFKSMLVTLPLIFVPVLLTAKQPDLGTAILLAIAGCSVLFLAGLSWRIISSGLIALGASIPLIWYMLYDYQRHRVLTFLNPENDPLGKGYHIIQSKIAIGSGGLFGKGWLNGTQSNLHFLPEHTTDFIFAVCGEEFGFIGSLLLISVYLMIVLRGLYVTIHAQDTFSRLLAGSITITFFVSFFINMGMVTGILPVVGIPLPLVSYGGSSMMTILASFGMLMSIQTHRKLVTT